MKYNPREKNMRSLFWMHHVFMSITPPETGHLVVFGKSTTFNCITLQYGGMYIRNGQGITMARLDLGRIA
jgi:hypothetical protein